MTSLEITGLVVWVHNSGVILRGCFATYYLDSRRVVYSKVDLIEDAFRGAADLRGDHTPKIEPIDIADQSLEIYDNDRRQSMYAQCTIRCASV